MMNPKAQEEFDAILAKAPETLDAYDRSILSVRYSYLSEADREKFGIEDPAVVQEREAKKSSKKESKEEAVPATADEPEAGEEVAASAPKVTKKGKGKK